MTGLIKKAVLGVAMASSALVASAPAEAQRWGGGYRGGYRHHDGIGSGGAAVLGGIVGLGLGAAIASSNRDRYYDRGYYYDAPPRVVYRERYYAPPPRVIYRDRYYRDGYYDRGYAPRGYYGY